MIAVLFLLPGQRDLENVAEERWENVSLARDLANTHANSHAPDKLIATDGEARVTHRRAGTKTKPLQRRAKSILAETTVCSVPPRES